ncbi:Succinyl-diaminopimelate desuccinylase [Planctomycetes bacterium Poly30]|uniref:Succinyl-diaminopimelate desuccinylase n=1 Tax=Saltatorellus ferox TaxID=2528018 RepID=A0A518EYN3_9BACT|nr:Succinyl-diaminopimelate desuccinylase [Planctomycetes bacterium Poly30]
MSRAFDDEDLIGLAHEIVSIPSVSGSEARASHRLVQRLGARGFQAEVDEAGSAVGVIGDGPVTIALVGHIDTVPGHPPVRIEDGVLFGRGSVDAKGPLVALAAGAARAVQRGAAARFVVVGCVEEEAPSSRGARHLLDVWPERFGAAPDALIIGEPSAWDGVTLGYKGYLRTSLTLETPSAHGAHDAPSAPELASDAWQRIRAAANAFAGPDATLFDSLMPRLLGLSSSHDGLVDRATLELALRLPEELDPEAATAWLQEFAPKASLLVRGQAKAWRGPRTSTVARAFGRAILNRGGKPRFQVKTGTADLNLLAPPWGCPSLAYGPGDAALDHTPNERVPLAELTAAAEVLTDALLTLGGVRPPEPTSSTQLAPGQRSPRREPEEDHVGSSVQGAHGTR